MSEPAAPCASNGSLAAGPKSTRRLSLAISYAPSPHRFGIEPFKRTDGTVYYRARIRLGDGSRARVDVPEKHTRAAGG